LAVCVSVCCCALVGGVIGSHIWSPNLLSVSLCVAVLWPRPNWKPLLVAEWGVCVSVCCCPLASGQIGSHIWSPSWLSVFLCVAARRPAARLQGTICRRVGCLCLSVLLPAGRRPGWKAHLVAVSADCLLCALLPVGRRPNWKPHLVAELAVCVSVCCCALFGGNLEPTFGRRRGCLCLCALLPAGQGPTWKLHWVAELVVCVC